MLPEFRVRIWQEFIAAEGVRNQVALEPLFLCSVALHVCVFAVHAGLGLESIKVVSEPVISHNERIEPARVLNAVAVVVILSWGPHQHSVGLKVAQDAYVVGALLLFDLRAELLLSLHGVHFIVIEQVIRQEAYNFVAV